MQGERVRAAGVATVSLITMVAVAATHHVQAAPGTHRLEVTPSTVAYGYYWSEARPALRIESGDIIDVDTLLTNTPEGLKRAGVADEKTAGLDKGPDTQVAQRRHNCFSVIAHTESGSRACGTVIVPPFS